MLSRTKAQPGIALIIVLLLLALLAIIGVSFITITTRDLRISQASLDGVKAHYRAEAGIAKAIWKLTNDPQWRNSFETDPDWSDTLAESDYSVLVENQALAKADLTSTSTTDYAQRVVKATAFKALGSGENDLAVQSDQDIFIWGGIVNITPDSIYANEDIEAQGASTVYVEKTAGALDQIVINWDSSLTAETLSSQNYPPPPNSRSLPAIDFDSDDPASYKSQAQVVGQLYNEDDFADLLTNNPTLTLTGVVYVTGDVDIKRGQDLTIQGVLVSDKAVSIGQDLTGTGFARLNITQVGSNPAGLLAKKNIMIGEWADSVTTVGLIYAMESFVITKFFPGFNWSLTGGLIAEDIDIWALSHNIPITHDDTIVQSTLGNPVSSPLIQIEHWEEAY